MRPLLLLRGLWVELVELLAVCADSPVPVRLTFHNLMVVVLIPVVVGCFYSPGHLRYNVAVF